MAVNMQRKTVLITGGTSGIGYETALGLAKLNAHVIITGRDAARGAEAAQRIKDLAGNPHVDVLLADLARQSEVRRLADEVKLRYRRLDVLINNVGALKGQRTVTEDGVELVLAVNHVNVYLLTTLLLPLLQASAPARVINLDGGMSGIKLDLDDLNLERKNFEAFNAYSRSKAAMDVASYALAQRLRGTGVTLNVAYPGAADTDMTRAMTPDMMPGIVKLMAPVFRLFMSNSTAEKAAQTSIYLASSPVMEGRSGEYFSPGAKAGQWPKQVFDAALRERLMTLTEAMIRVPELA